MTLLIDNKHINSANLNKFVVTYIQTSLHIYNEIIHVNMFIFINKSLENRLRSVMNTVLAGLIQGVKQGCLSESASAPSGGVA